MVISRDVLDNECTEHPVLVCTGYRISGTCHPAGYRISGTCHPAGYRGRILAIFQISIQVFKNKTSFNNSIVLRESFNKSLENPRNGARRIENVLVLAENSNIYSSKHHPH